jgi:biopolymer transport protein ExbD
VKRARKAVLVRPVSGPKSEINVTPLVDVVLVLLIIFMVVTPLQEKDLAVRIPTMEKVETTVDVPADQIVVRVEHSGMLKINGEEVAPSEYVATLSKRLMPRAAVDRVVFVTPNDDAPYKKLVEALDGARSAGAQTLGMTAVEGDEQQAPSDPPR